MIYKKTEGFWGNLYGYSRYYSYPSPYYYSYPYYYPDLYPYYYPYYTFYTPCMETVEGQVVCEN